MLCRLLAVHGYVDFTKADVLDPDWWRHYFSKRELLQHALLRDNFVGRLHYHCSALSAGIYEDAGAKVLDSLQHLLDWSHPWYQRDAAVAKRERVGSLKAAWSQAFGDMDAAETQAKINLAVAELDARLRAPADPEAEQISRFYENLGKTQTERLNRRRSA